MQVSIQCAIDAVMDKLVDEGHSEGSLLEYRKTFQRLITFAREAGADEYSIQIGAAFSAATTSPRTGQYSEYRRKKQGRCVRLLDSFITTGYVDLTRQKWQVKEYPESGSYCELLRDFVISMEEDGLSPSTVNGARLLAVGYLQYLETVGCRRIDDATPKTIFDYVVSLRSKWRATSMRSALAAFRPFIRFLAREDLICAITSIKTQKQRTIVPVLTEHEEEALWAVLQSGSITNRDCSIMLLGLLVGIRACDIIALELDDIDWHDDCISIIQQKTGNPLVLPLVPTIGNAVFRYLKEERPVSSCRRLFLRSVAPFEGLADHASIYNIIKKIFIKAGIHIEGRLCGAHLLRHNSATKMLSAGVALPTISTVLGHSDSESTNVYLSADEAALRDCVLSLKLEVK